MEEDILANAESEIVIDIPKPTGMEEEEFVKRKMEKETKVNVGDLRAKHLNNKVYIEGRLQTRDWEGQDGVKRYRTEIIADNMIMLDTKGTSGETAGFSARQSGADDDGSQPEPPTPAGDEIKVEDIPF